MHEYKHLLTLHFSSPASILNLNAVYSAFNKSGKLLEPVPNHETQFLGT